MSPIKPLKLYGGIVPPNPFKVAIILKELSIPYEIEDVPHSEVKGPAYEAVNPNGRLPSLYDPNRDITIWESGAIIEYLVSEYDKEHKLSFEQGTPEYYHAQQFLHFQMSGQGPYYGQAWWFANYHPEKVQSAIERYKNEMKRVTTVLNKALEGKEYLVGGKLSYADLAFFAWQNAVTIVASDTIDQEKETPNVHAWMQRMAARPEVKKLVEERTALQKQAKPSN